MTIKQLSTQYSEITIEKECPKCKGIGYFGDTTTFFGMKCKTCKGTSKIIQKHIVPNNGEWPLSYWIKKFEKEV